MADTLVPSALRVKQWDDNYFVEYIRGNRLARYMGTDENAIVQVKEVLTKKPGDTVYFELINKLAGAGRKNNQTLQGFEEDLSQRSFPLTINLYRHGVVVAEYEEQATAVDLRNAGKAALMNWSMEQTRDRFITALGSKDTVLAGAGQGPGGSGSTSAFQVTNATALNTWTTENRDRTLYGGVISNGSSNVFATALATVGTAAGKLTSSAVSVMKRMAKTSTPKIRPIKVNGDEEWYVMFAHSNCFRDLKLDTNIVQSRQYALERGTDNPLFTDGDIIWDGVIVREIPELNQNTWLAQGASSVDVGENYLCGAQALGYGLAQRWNTRTQEMDYKTKNGIAVQQIYDVGKLQFGTGPTDTTTPKDYGVLTGFFAAVGDA